MKIAKNLQKSLDVGVRKNMQVEYIYIYIYIYNTTSST